MASELPDALDKLALQETLTSSSSATSLSKYFGHSDSADDIFDTIVKPREEPKVDLYRSLPITDEKNVSASPSKTHGVPTVSFQKCEDEEPRIFSYFAQSPASTNDVVASEFFDQISQQASVAHVPLEITNPSSKIDQQQALSLNKISEAIPGNSPENIISVGQSVGPKQEEACVPSVVSPPPANPPAIYSSAASSCLPLNSGISSSPSLPVPLGSLPLSSILNVPFTGSSTSFSASSTERVPYPDKLWNRSQELASSWWIPEEETKKILDLCMVQNSSFKTESIKLATPGVSNSVELTDPIQSLLRHFDGEVAASNRQTLNADSVTQDDKGIQELIEAGCWRAAINLCGRLLTAYGQGYGKTGQLTKHTPHSLQLWFTRIALLVKTQQIDVAINEMVPFGNLDSPDLYFQYYPELYGNGKCGSMVPFSFRLLAAELPAYANKINEAQERLCQMLGVVRRIIHQVDQFINANGNVTDKENALRLWSDRELRVIHSLVNCALLKKDYHNGLQLLHQQIKKTDRPNPSLFSILGRVYLQLGDVARAQRAFNSASDMRDNSQPAEMVATLSDAALVAIAQNTFTEAYGYYQQALASDPENPMLVNNAAVCLLYLGRMKESMMMLEENLGTKPNIMLHNPTVLNICTLYELESSLTVQRKLGMLRLASQWKSDNLNSSSFKLQS